MVTLAPVGRCIRMQNASSPPLYFYPSILRECMDQVSSEIDHGQASEAALVYEIQVLEQQLANSKGPPQASSEVYQTSGASSARDTELLHQLGIVKSRLQEQQQRTARQWYSMGELQKLVAALDEFSTDFPSPHASPPPPPPTTTAADSPPTVPPADNPFVTPLSPPRRTLTPPFPFPCLRLIPQPRRHSSPRFHTTRRHPHSPCPPRRRTCHRMRPYFLCPPRRRPPPSPRPPRHRTHHLPSPRRFPPPHTAHTPIVLCHPHRCRTHTQTPRPPVARCGPQPLASRSTRRTTTPRRSPASWPRATPAPKPSALASPMGFLVRSFQPVSLFFDCN